MSEDQKHSSAVAKVHYQKQRSRKVALKGHEWLQKLQGGKGSEVDKNVYARLGDSTFDAAPSVETVQNISSSPEKDALPKRIMLRSQSNSRHVLKFTTEEGHFLKKGITKHGFGQWTAILRDHDFKFQDRRTTDSLKKERDSNFHDGHAPELNTFLNALISVVGISATLKLIVLFR